MAVPAPAAFDTVTVKPTWLPADTDVASAVLVIPSFGATGGVITMVARH